MRIAILADPLDNQKAGIHHYTVQLLKHLGESGSGNVYLAVRLRKGSPIEGVEQVIVPNYRWIPGYKAFRMFILLPMLLRKLKMDVVIEPAHFGPFNLPPQIWRVTVIHDLTPVMLPEFHNFHSQVLQRIFLKGILKRAGLVITNSECTRQDVLRVYPFTTGKTEVIYLGRDPAFVPARDPLVLEKYGLERTYFLFVGTIEPRKNLIILLKAFQLFRERMQEAADLVIVGQHGWKTASFDKALAQHPFRANVKVLGYLPGADLPAIYSHAVGYIQPSVYEGFGIPVVEAMSCGTPCIVSDVSSLPEIGGEAVLKFDPTDAVRLSDLMCRLFSDPSLRAELGEKALKRSEIFSWDNYAKRFDELLNGLRPGS